MITAIALSGSFLLKPKPLVNKITDGDTVKTSNKDIIRYIGFDAPEKGECYATEASQLNSDLILNKPVDLKYDLNKMDNFGRLLAYVFVSDQKTGKEIFVNEYLLRKGAGRYFQDTVNVKYQNRLVQAADSAHQENKGMWSVCAPDKTVGCIIKGNVSREGRRYYQLPTSRAYKLTVVSLEKGDRWFCTETDAIKAGFIKARE